MYISKNHHLGGINYLKNVIFDIQNYNYNIHLEWTNTNVASTKIINIFIY